MGNANDKAGPLWERIAVLERRVQRLAETLKNWGQATAHRFAETGASEGTTDEKPFPPELIAPDTGQDRPRHNGSRKLGYPSARTAEKAYGDEVYIEWLADGVHQPGRWYPPGEEAALLSKHKFNLVLDEAADALIVDTPRDPSNKPLYLMPAHIKVFLWLVLTNVGRPLTYGDIAEKLGYGRAEADSRDNRIHRTRNRFNKMFGSLSDRMFGPGKNRVYSVRQQGWSFCWLRETENPEDSTLLRDLQDTIS